MKSFLLTLIMLALLCLNSAEAKVSLQIKGNQAKKIYQTMSAIFEDGAAGHFYKKGKNIICRYTNADIDDSHGKLLPKGDSRRYVCAMTIGHLGQVQPGKL